MKLLVLFLLVSTLVCSDAHGPHFQTRACVDCYGRRVWPGTRYYDGCNWCTCNGYWRASCTYRACYENTCFRRGRHWERKN